MSESKKNNIRVQILKNEQKIQKLNFINYELKSQLTKLESPKSISEIPESVRKNQSIVDKEKFKNRMSAFGK